MKSMLAAIMVLGTLAAFAQEEPRLLTVNLTSVQFTPFEAEENGVVAVMRLPKRAQGAYIYVGPYDEARAQGLENLRRALDALKAELDRDTAPVEIEGMPPMRVRTGSRVKITRTTTVNRSKRDIEETERRAAESAHRMIEGYAKTLDIRATPAASSGKAVCAPIGPGKLIVCAFARLPDTSKKQNLAPTRFVYWWGIIDCPENGGMATALSETNATEWFDIFR